MLTEDQIQRVTDRPWPGKCATTGKTMEQFFNDLKDSPAYDHQCRAAVSICRAYGIRGCADPGYIVNVMRAEGCI